MNLVKDTECTHFLCPDEECELFTKPDCHVPCDKECPHEAKKAVICRNCGETIILDYDHFSWCRIDCPYCNGTNWQRMSGRYRRYNLTDEEKKLLE